VSLYDYQFSAVLSMTLYHIFHNMFGSKSQYKNLILKLMHCYAYQMEEDTGIWKKLNKNNKLLRCSDLC
jgi:hypothetical protein